MIELFFLLLYYMIFVFPSPRIQRFKVLKFPLFIVLFYSLNQKKKKKSQFSVIQIKSAVEE